MADQVGESRNQIQRYIRLTELLTPLPDLVEGKNGMNPAYELSFLKPIEQKILVEVLNYEQATPALAQVQWMKKFSQEEKLTEDVVLAIMSEEKSKDLLKLYFHQIR